MHKREHVTQKLQNTAGRGRNTQCLECKKLYNVNKLSANNQTSNHLYFEVFHTYRTPIKLKLNSMV
jgi:hypothetical protein